MADGCVIRKCSDEEYYMRRRTLRLLRGDLAVFKADALCVSANATLSGQANPMHWRFNGRRSCDGAMRARGGEQLAAHAMHALPTNEPRRVAQGDAVVTPAAGHLECRWVIHAVAPDALYGGDPASNEAILQQTLESVIARAEGVGARSIGCCAIGCGVMGFRPAIAARETFAVAARWLEEGTASSLQELSFVLFADDVWRTWPAIAAKRCGPAHSVEGDDESRTRTYAWHSDLL